MAGGLEHLSCEEGLKVQDLLSLGKGHFQGKLVAAPQYLQGGYEKTDKLFMIAYSVRKRNKHKLKEEIQTGRKRKLFHPADSQGVNRLSREFVQSPSLEAFKIRLDKSLSSLA